jgi:hypothetical protein
MRRTSSRERAPVRKQDVRDLLRATVFVGTMFAALVVNAVAG